MLVDIVDFVNSYRIKCWGRNDKGQLGLGDTNDWGKSASELGDALPYVELGTDRTATAVAAGDAHTCALLDNSLVKCWGHNNNGQLGLGDSADRGDASGEMGNTLPYVDVGTGRTVIAVAAAYTHTCAVLDNGSVKCWGDNGKGQLGLGDNTNRGDSGGQTGDALPSVDVGTGRTVTAVATGSEHTCALLDNALLKCWGNNDLGQLGLGDNTDRGDSGGQMGDSLPFIDLGTGRTVTSVASGLKHNCAVLDDGSIKCWGDNNSGQLGIGDRTEVGGSVGDMGDNLSITDMGSGLTGVQITAGMEHSCAKLNNGRSKCWGANNKGMLGIGDTADRGDGPSEMGDFLETVHITGIF